MSSDADGGPGGAWWQAPWVAVVAMVVLVASAGVITWVLMRAMQDEPDGIAAPTAPSTMAPPPVAATPDRPQTPGELATKWTPKLDGLSKPCLADPYTAACVDAADALRASALNVAADAKALDLPGVEIEAERVADEASGWERCLSTLSPGDAPMAMPQACFVDIQSTVRHGDRFLIGELHAAKREN